jgi:hypothetical protein
MAKDKAGHFHPKKGSPSKSGRSKAGGNKEAVTNADGKIDDQLARQDHIEEAYGVDTDREQVSGAKVLHPNRKQE